MDSVKASPDAQLRLLELADLDSELGRLQHRRRGLPEIAEIDRLDAGQVSSPRELGNLQSELESLRRRQDDLEEVELSVMERQEEASSRARSLTAERSDLAATRADMAARRDAAAAEINEQLGKLEEQRSGIAAGIPDDLLGLYDKLREQHGVGAAALRRGRCEGCHLALDRSELNNIRAAPPDEVLRCEECRRILVRTPESGL